MSYIVGNILYNRLFNVQPSVRTEGHKLLIESGWKSHLLSLGASSSRTAVDTKTRLIRIQTRRFWFANAVRVIRFEWVDAVEYGYSGYSAGLVTEDQDIFTVALRLKQRGESVPVCRFVGSGDFANNTPLPDWLFLDRQLEARLSAGDQESSSLRLVDILSSVIGVPIVNP